MNKPEKIRWTGKEFGKYLQGQALVRGRLKTLVNCYGNRQGNFLIHERYLDEYPNSWEEILEEVETIEVIEEK